MVRWDPDILIVTGPKDVAIVRTDATFKQLKAVRGGRVYVAPVGAHTWANRTAEQPLTVLWAAKTFHPARFAALDVPRDVKAFYREFFGHDLTDAQIGEQLDAPPRRRLTSPPRATPAGPPRRTARRPSRDRRPGSP